MGQAALFNELGVQIMHDAFTRGACVCACVYLAGCDGWWMALHCTWVGLRADTVQ